MRWLPSFVFALFLWSNSAAWADAILVIPFFNESGAENVDWIGESIAETVRESLASQNVLVLSREDRLEACRRLSIRPNAILTHASVMKLGEALDASQVIYGHYQIASRQEEKASPGPQSQATAAGPAGPAVSPRDSLRISARILDLQHTRQGPEFEQIGALEDLASLETSLAWRCLKLVAPATAISEQEFHRDRPSLRVDAIENYIRGLLAHSLVQQHRLFTQAVRIEPRFS